MVNVDKFGLECASEVDTVARVDLNRLCVTNSVLGDLSPICAVPVLTCSRK